MEKNNLNGQLFDSNMEAPLSIGDAEFNSKINEIYDNDTLLKFCKLENENNEKLNGDQKEALVNKIKGNILSQNKNLSIETIFELSILLNGEVKLNSLYGIKISELDNFKFDSLKPIFDFIKKHKSENNNADNIENYIKLIRYFVRLESVKTCNIKNFLEVLEFDFANQNAYKDLTRNKFLDIIGVLRDLLEYLEKEDNREDIAKVIEDILSYAPCNILNVRSMVLLLHDCKEKNINISIEVGKERIAELYKLFCPESLNFYHWCMLLSCCKDHSMSQDIFEMMMKNVNFQEDFIKTVFLPYMSTNKYNQTIKDKFGKYIFTPSLISFIKQKFNFNENYDLEKVLQDTFGKDNFVEGNDCDLGAILYRLHFESYLLIPHKKEDVIKLFESTKSLLPGQYQTLTGFWDASIKRKFDWDFCDIYSKLYNGGIYEEMNKFVKQIFIEKGVLEKDSSENNKIVLENQVDNNYNSELTLEDVKIMVCSKFEIGDYGITKQKFRTLIPSKIDNQYYLIWLLEFYRCKNDQYMISKENFIFCVRRYKFIGSKDFNDFCFYIGKCTAYDKIRFDVDCVNALLDAYGDCKYTGRVPLINNKGVFSGYDEDYIIGYMNNVIKNVEDQDLVNKISQKFGIKLDIDNKVNSRHGTDLSASKNQDQQCLDKQHINDKNKTTPLRLIIITLGLVILIPWLFKKIFGCCYNFEDDNIIADEYKNKEISSQKSMPNQDNNLEKNLDSKDNGFE